MNAKPYILMLEEKPEDAALISRVLGAGELAFELACTQTREDFERALVERRPDVILSDHSSPPFDSLNALAIARKRCPEVPFILVTDSAEDPLALAGLERGADAFLAKNLLPHWLPKLKRSLQQARRGDEYRSLQKRLHERAEANRRTATQLEQLLARRTRDLQNATRELEAFSYSISHDLRAPLRHINAFISLLEQSLKGSLTEESRGRLQIVAQAAEHLGKLVDALLHLSRVGRQELSRLPVSLTSLVTEARDHLRDETVNRDVEWVLGDLPVVHGDPVALRQVYVNLLSNALKYSAPRARARVEIACQENGDHTVCYVRDNGVGFDNQYATKLFGVFQRLHSDKEFEGTGIGLAIVRRIIQRHGGRVWAHGTAGRGATFYFSLPKKPVPVAA
jgi:two-component system, sensor histidine kinase and response regulator